MDLFETVRIKKDRFYDYPHQLSGGMRQRNMITMAVALKPKLIIADEPTTALDVIVQARIMNLFKDLRKKFGTSIMLISHDIALIFEVADKVGVMYGGQLMEFSSSRDIVEKPLHPYTKALLSAIQISNPASRRERIRLTGEIPSAIDMPSGCRFHTRCPLAVEICSSEEPSLKVIKEDHWLFAIYMISNFPLSFLI